jgi:hypothetical protein
MSAGSRFVSTSLLLLTTLPLTTFQLLAIDGTVINKSTNQPVPEAGIVLMRLGEGGMMPAGTTRSEANGKFKFDLPVDGMLMLQAAYKGVTYNKVLRQGDTGVNLELEVYDVSAKSTDTTIAQHMMLFEPNEGKLTINESVIYRNNGKTSFADPANGSFRFYLPPEAEGKVQVRVAGPGNMPINKDPEKTNQEGVYKVDFPLKPGESRFDLLYSVPLTSPAKLKGRILHPISEANGQTRAVTPSGVKLAGEGIEDLGAEPQTQAQVYSLTKANYEIEVTGTGSLRALEADESGSPEPQAIPPKIHERMWWIVGLSSLALAFGFIILWNKKPA